MERPTSGGRRRDRGVSKVVGSLLLVAIVVLLSVSLAAVALGFSERLHEAQSVDVLAADQCANDRVIQFGGDFGEFHEELGDNPCALWLDGSEVVTDGSGRVARWTDRGPNGFHATQANATQRPERLSAASAPGGLDAPVVRFRNNATLRPGCDPGDHEDDSGCSGDDGSGIRFYDEGDYLEIGRDVGELGVDEDSGLVVAAVVYTERFDRGGTWTIGEAGATGREFSMRTRGDDATFPWGSPPVPPDDHWRAQHWDVADVDFTADSTGEWILLVHAYDGEEVEVRVDGAEVASEPADLDLSHDRDVQIGRWERTAGDPSFYYHGAMAELIVFDRELTDEELSELEDYFAARYDPIQT